MGQSDPTHFSSWPKWVEPKQAWSAYFPSLNTDASDGNQSEDGDWGLQAVCLLMSSNNKSKI